MYKRLTLIGFAITIGLCSLRCVAKTEAPITENLMDLPEPYLTFGKPVFTGQEVTGKLNGKDVTIHTTSATFEVSVGDQHLIQDGQLLDIYTVNLDKQTTIEELMLVYEQNGSRYFMIYNTLPTVAKPDAIFKVPQSSFEHFLLSDGQGNITSDQDVLAIGDLPIKGGYTSYNESTGVIAEQVINFEPIEVEVVLPFRSMENNLIVKEGETIKVINYIGKGSWTIQYQGKTYKLNTDRLELLPYTEKR